MCKGAQHDDQPLLSSVNTDSIGLLPSYLAIGGMLMFALAFSQLGAGPQLAVIGLLVATWFGAKVVYAVRARRRWASVNDQPHVAKCAGQLPPSSLQLLFRAYYLSDQEPGPRARASMWFCFVAACIALLLYSIDGGLSRLVRDWQRVSLLTCRATVE